jgi:hypothetical protein
MGPLQHERFTSLRQLGHDRHPAFGGPDVNDGNGMVDLFELDLDRGALVDPPNHR